MPLLSCLLRPLPDCAVAALAGDILLHTKEWLQNQVGPKKGERLWQFANCIDERHLKFDQQRKSIGTDVNWGIRFTEEEQAKEFLDRLCQELSDRLLSANKLYVSIVQSIVSAGTQWCHLFSLSLSL
jgi:nucleotidyltransferase/DNA polymerase involved in DNA repair